ncbi:MAG: hypothetical protein R2857_15185 [Vampirovibrionales bacterium]
MNFFPSVQASVGNAPLGYLPGQQQVNYQSDFGYAQPWVCCLLIFSRWGYAHRFSAAATGPSPYNPYPTPTPALIQIPTPIRVGLGKLDNW